MGLLDKIKKVFKGKDKKNNKPSYNPEQMKWAQVAYEQALKRKEPFINHEAAGSGELNEKILLKPISLILKKPLVMMLTVKRHYQLKKKKNGLL